MNITPESLLAKLPIAHIARTIRQHIQPLMKMLPDQRMARVVEVMLSGILAGQTPVITRMARQNSKENGESWATARRIYRLLANRRFETRVIYEGLYKIGQQVVEQEQPEYLVVAVDTVNFEKPYGKSLEGVSMVHKSTPPDFGGKARLTRGYPAITAAIVNTRVPVTSYANWFSYQTPEFISQNKEIEQALETTCRLYPGYPVRFVGDAGLDDQKIFAQVQKLQQAFIFRVCHFDSMVEVYNDRLGRWESEALEDLVDSIPYQAAFEVLFTHAHQTRLVTVQLGWFKIRIPNTLEPCWVLVVENPTFNRPLVLITNIPLENVTTVKQVYTDWRLRTRIEHGCRFDQEQGLDVEDMRVQTLERMRRLFAFVLLAAQIVFVIGEHWPPKAVLWLRQLGGKLGLPSDRDGPYCLLPGIAAVITTAVTLSLVFLHPFPFEEWTYG